MFTNSQSTIEKLFFTAVEAEETGDMTKAVEIYQQIIAAQANYAAAYVNLGTLAFRDKEFNAAAALYRKAIEIDPNYTMAYFDYANALEELGHHNEARQIYERAVEINPRHADSHFNLALAYERNQEPRKAILHWRIYLQLDKTSQWSSTARQQLKKLLALERLQVVTNTEKPERTFGPRPALVRVK